MSQTILQQFIDANAAFITAVCLAPICKWVRENPDEEVTEEKLLAALKIPAPVAVRTPQRNTPPQPLATAAPKRTRRTTVSTERPRCKWFFTKGDNVGKQCPSYSKDGSEYCSACYNKKGAGGTGRKAAAAAAGGGGASSSGGKPPKSGKSGFTSANRTESKDSTGESEYEIRVDDFGQSKDGFTLFLDSNSGFVLKYVDDDTYTVIGFCDDPDNKTMRVLTKAEKEKAKKLLELEVEDGVELA